MENIVDFFKGFNIQDIISFIAIVWFLTNSKFKKINEDLKELKTLQANMNDRLNKFEGRFEERGYLESRNKKIGEE